MADQTEATVTATRYAVSLLPFDDINFNAFALHVQRRRDGWGITDGAGWVKSRSGHWTLDHYEALLFPAPEPAIALARKIAPNVTVNGTTAATVRDAARQAAGQPAAEPVVAYLADFPRVTLYCREHGEGRPKLVPRTADDLPFGGICTTCGRDVLILAGQPDPTTADDPTPLRWGLGDVLHGDDDIVTVCLSGPDREPYWLELDPERAAAFRDDLTPPAAGLAAPTNHNTETEARDTDVTWSVVFITDSGDAWQEWSKGWHRIEDAVVSGETVASIATVAEVRFVRTTTVRERFNLHQLAAGAES